MRLVPLAITFAMPRFYVGITLSFAVCFAIGGYWASTRRSWGPREYLVLLAFIADFSLSAIMYYGYVAGAVCAMMAIASMVAGAVVFRGDKQ